jgi:hypothetical protein
MQADDAVLGPTRACYLPGKNRRLRRKFTRMCDGCSAEPQDNFASINGIILDYSRLDSLQVKGITQDG